MMIKDLIKDLTLAQNLIDNYEQQVKVDMIDMLEELQTEIDAMSDTVVDGRTVTVTCWEGMQKKICNIIQEKIDALRGKENDN